MLPVVSECPLGRLSGICHSLFRPIFVILFTIPDEPYSLPVMWSTWNWFQTMVKHGRKRFILKSQVQQFCLAHQRNKLDPTTKHNFQLFE